MRSRFRISVLIIICAGLLGCNLISAINSRGGIGRDERTATAGMGMTLTVQAQRITQIVPAEIARRTPGAETPEPGQESKLTQAFGAIPLPEETNQLQKAIQAAGLDSVLGLVEVYGENRSSLQDETTTYFTPLETDFRLRAEVQTLQNVDAMGNLTLGILRVLQSFPPDTFPGKQQGYVGITYVTGTDQLNLWFPVGSGTEALNKGLDGAALFEFLR